MKLNLQKINKELENKTALDIIKWAYKTFEHAELVNPTGPNLFYKSVENRKKYCYVRKVKPLKKALEDAQAWMSGLRRSQAESRGNIQVVSFNETHDCYKIAPLFNWSETDVWEYIRNQWYPL